MISTILDSRIAVNQALQVLEIFRDLNQEMPIGEVVSFLLIANGETRDGGGITITEVGNLGRFAMGTASRYVNTLCLKDRKGKPGREVVEKGWDPLDERKTVLRISPKGHRLIQRIQQALKK